MSRRAAALHISVVAVISALMLLLALPAGALGASTAAIVTDTADFQTRVVVTGDAANNVIVVTLSGGTYTVTDTTVVTAGLGCSQAGTDVTCPATGIFETLINGGAGDDTITGSSGGDTINGGDGADNINGGAGPDDIDGLNGDDLLNSGGGGIPGFDPGTGDFSCVDIIPPFRCTDNVQGSNDFDTVTYADRTGPINVDLRPGQGVGRDDDGTTDGINGIEKVVGGQASDELVGGIGPETFNGGPGNVPDTICGGLGKDTVDYSDKDERVTVTLDGALATDPDILSSDSARTVGARRDCRLPIKSRTGGANVNGQPCLTNSYLTFPSCRKDFVDLDAAVQPPAEPDPITGEGGPAPELRDCTHDDGVAGENDCVGEDIENVVGSPGDDVLVGNDVDALYGLSPRVEPAGENVLEGGAGNDVLDGSLGADIFDGGPGSDAVSYEGRADAIAASIDGAANDGSELDRNVDNNQSDQIMPNVEDLIGGHGDDVLKGDGSGNVLLGGPGNDRIQGHGANDKLGGDEGADRLEGGEGGDAMDGGPDDDLLFGGFGNDTYDGGDGTDTADFSDATTPVSVTLNGAADDGRVFEFEGDYVGDTIESLIGGLDDDKLNANDGNGTIQGGGGNDVLNGGLGADLLVGGRCQDQDAPICEDQVGVGDPKGVDTAAYGGHPGPVDVTLASAGGDGVAGENDVIAGDVESIGGSRFDDVLSGDAKLNTINGGAGNDRISGAEGDDFLAGDLGNDTINGDVGDDIVDGAEGNDTLNGTAGNDTLRGFTGTDILDGGTGADTMSGGDGVDTVSYASRSADVNVDTLGDPDDGQQGENDQVRTDVESVRTGSGDDRINVNDGAAGAVTCGGGTDEVEADAADEIGSGCEAGGVRQSAACVPTSSGGLRMSGAGAVSLRLRCAFNARGSVQLRSAGRVKVGKGKARRMSLGKKSFTGKAGQLVTVRVNVAKGARSAIKRRKRLRVQTTISVRRDGTSASSSKTSRKKLTLRASGG